MQLSRILLALLQRKHMIEDILKISRTLGVNKEQYGLWAKTAAKRFLEDDVPLNDSIRKIAAEHELNSNEVDRVVEMANLETYSQRLKQSSPNDKSFEFPVADRAKIVPGGAEKTAMPQIFVTDFDRPLDTDLSRTAGMDLFEAFGVSGIEKVAQDSARGEALVQKLERLAELTQDKLAMNLEQSMETAEKFFDMIKQEILKGKTFDEVQSAVMAKADSKEKAYADRIGELTAYAKRKLYDAGLLQLPGRTGDSTDDPTQEKSAEPVPKAMVTDTWESPGVTVSVINGRHPMFAAIDTLVTQFEEADKTKNNLIILEDKIRYTKSRVRGKKQPL